MPDSLPPLPGQSLGTSLKPGNQSSFNLRRSMPRGARLLAMLGIILILVLGLSWGKQPGFSSPFERNSLGLRFAIRSQRYPEVAAASRKKIALVAIRDSTLQDRDLAGPMEYTLPRDRHAKLVDALVAGGAKAIVFDLLFDISRPEDKQLADAVRRARQAGCSVVWAIGWRDAEEEGQSPGLLLPNRALLKASSLTGHTRYRQDGEYPLLDSIEPYIAFGDQSVPALSLSGALAYDSGENLQKKVSLFNENDPTAVFPIDFSPLNTAPFASIPYESVYHSTGGHNAFGQMRFFQNRLVIVGDVTQLNHDVSVTPLGEMPGVAIHAQAMATLLSDHWLHYATTPQSILAILGVLAIGMMVGASLRSWTALVVGASWLLLYVMGNILVFCDRGFILPLIAPLLAGFLGTILAMAERSWFQEKDKRRLDTIVAQYASPELSLEGAPQGIVTLVFCDIVGSSEMSIEYGPRFETARNQYFDIVRAALLKNHGFEVETAGDSLFAVFHRANDALFFGLDTQKQISQHKWPEGLDDIVVRVGLHTGNPIVGRDRSKLTYRGADTNKANRITATGLGGDVVLSSETRDALRNLPSDIEILPREIQELKGVGQVESFLAIRRS